MRNFIPLDLWSRSFIPLPSFIRSRRPIPLLAPSLVLFPPCSVLPLFSFLQAAHVGCLLQKSIGFYTHHSFSVTFLILGCRLFYCDVTEQTSWLIQLRCVFQIDY
jgi:hypothetical protein